MLLTCYEAIEQGLLILDYTKGKPAQIGYDLSIKSIRALEGTGAIWTDMTDGPVLSDPIEPEEDFITGRNLWHLDSGVYDVTFWEGCALPEDVTGFIVQRSGVYRNGGLVTSPAFDPGFKTPNIGTVLYLSFPLRIEQNARLAQMYFFKHSKVKNPYNGQWQGDKWRDQGNPLNN